MSFGHQIKRTAVDICDDLKGDYPKDFQFTSWHPHCRCIATPILKTREELKRDRQLIRDGKAPQGSVKEVKELPPNFKQWQTTNAKRIAEATERGTLPHWYRDNQKLIEGAKPAPTPKSTTIERAKARHQARTPKQIADIKRRWNDRQLDRAINTHQRKGGMSFLEANRGNGNVGYIAGYGYENGKGYKINCQSCVVAHEMRLRGHNVTARPNTAKRNNMPDKLSRKTEMAWINPKTNQTPITQQAGGKIGYKTKTRKQQCDEFTQNTSAQGRYHMSFAWKGKKYGHIVTLERSQSGTLNLYDPQTGEIIKGESKIIEIIKDKISPSYPITTYRVDNLLLDVNVAKRVVYKTMNDL